MSGQFKGGYDSPTTTPANGNPPQSVSSQPTMPDHDLYRSVESTVIRADALNRMVTEHLGGAQ
ncbi:hypothetical protein [Kitasatospora acidiphila]|uniref:hypothetical protein n=1 Tax=Kitasatospora acidiphila TaxID=2567942 RepID=UPI003C756885